jgi:hypothetical protein
MAADLSPIGRRTFLLTEFLLLAALWLKDCFRGDKLDLSRQNWRTRARSAITGRFQALSEWV